MPYELREYQSKCVDAVRMAYRAGKRAPLLVAPTGAGKTVIFCHISESAASKGKRVMVLVHRAELLDQTSNKLDENGVAHGLIASGESMNQTHGVQVASVQTLVRRLDRIVPPDLIICDEAHHGVAGSWAKVLEAFPKARVLGVTATPQRLDGKGLGGVFDDLIRGPEVQDLINQGFLCKPIYYAPRTEVNLDGVKITAGEYNRAQLAPIVDRPKIVGDAVAHYARICPGVPALAFCVSLEHAEHTAEAFRAAGFRWNVIDGTLSDTERKDRVRSLADGRLHGLCSVELVNEGFDVPVCGCGILLRPTHSLSLHLQQLGRALRPAKDKRFAYFLDHVGNTLRHGLAEEQREWTLDGGADRKKAEREGEAAARLRTCPRCYAVHAPAPSCPQCQHVYDTGRKVEQVAGELVALNPWHADDHFDQCPKCLHAHAKGLQVCPKCGRNHAKIAEWTERRQNIQERAKAESLDELTELGRRKGYKNARAWALHVFKAREDKRKADEALLNAG